MHDKTTRYDTYFWKELAVTYRYVPVQHRQYFGVSEPLSRCRDKSVREIHSQGLAANNPGLCGKIKPKAPGSVLAQTQNNRRERQRHIVSHRLAHPADHRVFVFFFATPGTPKMVDGLTLHSTYTPRD